MKWSDGTPMTAADVAFTFNLMKKFPALDLNSVWSVLSSVHTAERRPGRLTFKTRAVPYFYYIADQVFIVPAAHLGEDQEPGDSTRDANPVGTGAVHGPPVQPPEHHLRGRTPHYWEPGEPKIARDQYPAFTSNDPANTYLATGQAQWGGQFIPNIKAFYLSKSTGEPLLVPPIANVSAWSSNLNVPG